MQVKGHFRIFEVQPDGGDRLVIEGDNLLTRRGRQWILGLGLTIGSGNFTFFDPGLANSGTSDPFQCLVASTSTAAPFPTEDQIPTGTIISGITRGTTGTGWTDENFFDSTGLTQYRRVTINIPAGVMTGTWQSLCWAYEQTNGTCEGSRWLISGGYTKGAGITARVQYDVYIS